jgi:Protein of unknown function (DUF2892)
MNSFTPNVPVPTVHDSPSASSAPHSASVMRQTQGLIGLVILASTSAAYFVHPAWLVGPAIIGTGLLVSGFTGVCPMAFAVARLPWNKADGHDAAKQSCCKRC